MLLLFPNKIGFFFQLEITNRLWILIKLTCILLFYLCYYFLGLYGTVCLVSDYIVVFIQKYIYSIQQEYDYIIVGAGTAGSVIALRLSEDKNISVLLLEAGGYGGMLLDIPIVAPRLHKTVYDWQYETVPQKHSCLGLNNNASFWPAGKIFGGTGRLNHLMYTRGHPDDYKDWYKDLKDFDYKQDILEYFKKSEYQVGSYSNDTEYHSTNKGPLYAADSIFVSEFYDAVAETASKLGFPVRDINGKHNSGFSKPQVNIKDGWRFTTGHYLLKQSRPNLLIKVFSHVEKILFKGNFEAYAVKYNHLGHTYITKARKGIILSAGVIGSAKILMLSGVGKESHLNEIGIKVKRNLPVGDNLQDHVSTGSDLIIMNQTLSINFYSLFSPANHLKYLFSSNGPLTSIGCEVLALLNTNCLNHPEVYELCERKAGRPNMEYVFLSSGFSSDFGLYLKDIVNLKKEAWDNYFSHVVDNNTATALTLLLHPKSKGTVRLKNKDPSSKPLIDPNYLSHLDDVKTLVEGLKYLKKFVESSVMRKHGASFNTIKYPACEEFEFGADDYWACYARHVTLTLYHPVGTCKMGPADDPTSVVDYEFRIIGTNKLFVADGSVMPSLTSAHTNGPIVLLAEKAASVIKYYRYFESGVCYLKDIFVKMMICDIS